MSENASSSHKIRVMHFLETLGVGGLENGIVNIANHIDTESFDCLICCFGTKGELAARLQKKETTLIELGYGQGVNLLSVFKIANIFKSYKIDIVHTHGWGARYFLAFCAAHIAGVPVKINGEHGTIYIDKFVQRVLQKCMVNCIDGTLSVSYDLKQKLMNKFAFEDASITVIPNGVDTNRFHGGHDTSCLRQELGIPANHHVVAIVGSLKWQKNQHVAIQALEMLKSRGYPVTLVCVGDGPDKSRLIELSKQHLVSDDVVFTGIRDDIPEMLSLADILVLPSVPDYEGMSNVILEAMASKTPVISSYSIGAVELIKDGLTGLLFPYDRPEVLSEKIQLLISDKQTYTQIAANSAQLIDRQYSIKGMVEKYEDYYRQVYSLS